MPIQISWFLEGRIILARNSGKVTFDEWEDAAKITLDYLNSAQIHPVHIIQHSLLVTAMPGRSITTIIHMANHKMALSQVIRHPSLGWTVALNPSHQPVYTSLGNIASQIFRIKYRAVSDAKEALHFLQAADQTLPTLENYDMLR